MKNAQKYQNISVNFHSRHKCETFSHCFYHVIMHFYQLQAGLCARPVMPVIMTGEIEKGQVKLRKKSSD